MMNSINETNNEVNAHISKLEISGDDKIDSESDKAFSQRKQYVQNSEYKSSARK